jgi:hypothetical protein
VIVARLTSMRTLLVIADARVTTDQPLPATATTGALRVSLQNARRIAEGRNPGPDGIAWCAPDGRSLPHICGVDPALPSCQEGLKGAAPIPCPPTSTSSGEE